MPRGIKAQFSEYEQRAIGLAVELGWSVRDIANFLKRDKSVIHRFLKKLAAYPENPEDVEIVTPFHLTPSSAPTQIYPGDAAYCVVSDQTGIEDHPKLRKPRPKKPEKSKATFKPKAPRRKKATA